MDIANKQLEQYAVAHSSKVPELMDDLREFTFSNVALPQMQVGPLEGNFLKVLARITGAKRIVEVGTFTGYSGLMLASGLPDDGELITCELDPENARIARTFFDRSPHGHKIHIKLGPAWESLAGLSGPFDMAFIDADKVGYIGYFDQIRPMMRPGGLMVVDNVLWSGEVLSEQSEQSESTQAIVAFNKHITQLAELDKVMITLRDGMTLVVT